MLLITDRSQALHTLRGPVDRSVPLRSCATRNPAQSLRCLGRVAPIDAFGLFLASRMDDDRRTLTRPTLKVPNATMPLRSFQHNKLARSSRVLSNMSASRQLGPSSACSKAPDENITHQAEARLRCILEWFASHSST